MHSQVIINSLKFYLPLRDVHVLEQGRLGFFARYSSLRFIRKNIKFRQSGFKFLDQLVWLYRFGEVSILHQFLELVTFLFALSLFSFDRLELLVFVNQSELIVQLGGFLNSCFIRLLESF